MLGQRVRLTTSPPSVSGLYTVWDLRHLNLIDLQDLLHEQLSFLYVDDVLTSQEVQTSTACYGDNFTCLYVDDVRTSQEVQTTTACYGDNFTCLYVDDVRTSQEAPCL
jgi:hypothetical protein